MFFFALETPCFAEFRILRVSACVLDRYRVRLSFVGVGYAVLSYGTASCGIRGLLLCLRYLMSNMPTATFSCCGLVKKKLEVTTFHAAPTDGFSSSTGVREGRFPLREFINEVVIVIHQRPTPFRQRGPRDDPGSHFPSPDVLRFPLEVGHQIPLFLAPSISQVSGTRLSSPFKGTKIDTLRRGLPVTGAA